MDYANPRQPMHGYAGLQGRMEMNGTDRILNQKIVGIDFGSKFAGTTVICYNSGYKVRFIESSKNSDADAFLRTELDYIRPDLIMIDAPLSLPGVYWLGDGYIDHFFRKCDRDLGAMSPMFLGGLTTRAMQLKKYLNSEGFRIHETWPRKLVTIMGLPVHMYKKRKSELPDFSVYLQAELGIRVNSSAIPSWHHMDALLAFVSGIRFIEGQCLTFGLPEEGRVFI